MRYPESTCSIARGHIEGLGSLGGRRYNTRNLKIRPCGSDYIPSGSLNFHAFPLMKRGKVCSMF